jgi:hypothetical protein
MDRESLPPQKSFGGKKFILKDSFLGGGTIFWGPKILGDTKCFLLGKFFWGQTFFGGQTNTCGWI